MIVTKTIETTWCRRYKSFYTSKGYKFTYYGDKFIVNIKHLAEHSNTKIIAKCDVCGKEKEITYQNYNCVVKNNYKYICSNCNSSQTVRPNQKTTEQFKKEIYDLVENEYSVIGKYINAGTKILMRHSECGNEFDMRPNSFLSGHRCPICTKEKEDKGNDNIRIETNTLITEKYKNKFKILTPYINNKTKILIKCLVCKNEYLIGTNVLIYGNHKCLKCKEIEIKSRPKKISRPFIDDDYIKHELSTLTHGEYELIGHYEKSNIPVSVKHNKCGHTYNIRRGDFIYKGCRCPQCYITDKCKELGITVEEWGKDGDHDNRKLQKWSAKVKKRDNKRCVICGDTKNLNAHHLNGYHWDIENRNNIKNGVTLCEDCHYKFHNIYGWGGNTKEQFEKFKKPIQLTLTI